eukprot:gnl/Spiro4/20814_TR10132_c0_g1_i1.p4 gnl/Spiro4/20814_TR10132_c0_g1~~gnl/Spiro4/20814_TR10132_c0_g1_i1.p4  ORF type:complete len:269 (+),score=-11.67 gnl/Spiro4/20814_TR10132_c0_g1_i1:3187-3993(+)
MPIDIPVFVISLKSSTERRKRLDEHFKKMGLPFEFMDAVYGKDLNDIDIATYCDMQAVKNAPNWLTRSAIGCALSHLNIYKEVIRRNLPYAVIFEDDVIINKDFKQQVEALLPKLKKNEVVSFFYQSWEPLKLVGNSTMEFYKDYKLYEVADVMQPISAAAYLITQDACKTLSNAIIPIRYTADAWGEYKTKRAIENFRCVYPKPVNIVDAKSTIQYLNDDWKGKLMKWIDRYKVFPVYQLLKMKRKAARQKMMGVQIVNTTKNSPHA